MTPGHGAEFSRACEGHHEVSDGSQHTLLVFQPGWGLVILAVGTMPVLTGVGAVVVVSACVAVRERAAKSLCAARRTVVHGAKMRGEHPVAKVSSGVRAMDAEEVSSRDHPSALMMRLMACDPSAAAVTVSWVERLGVVGAECPRDACMRRRLTPAASRWVAQRWRSV